MMTAVLEHPQQSDMVSDTVTENSVVPADEEDLSNKTSTSVCAVTWGR